MICSPSSLRSYRQSNEIQIKSGAPTKEIKWTDKGQSKFYRSTFRDSFAKTDRKFDGQKTVFETEIVGSDTLSTVKLIVALP